MLEDAQGLHSHYDKVNRDLTVEASFKASMKLSMRSVEGARPAMMLLWRTTLLMSR